MLTPTQAMLSSQKYEFAGPEWRAYMHAVVSSRLEQLEDRGSAVDWSFCEVFRNAPKHLQTDGSAAVWHCIVEGGQLTFGEVELRDPTFKVVADYDAIYPLAKFHTKGDSARASQLARMSQALMEEGKLSVVGDPAKLDPRFGSFHDAIAAVTA